VVSAQKQVRLLSFLTGCHLFITRSGMYALRERRQHVTHEDFEFAVAKVNRFSQVLRLKLIVFLPPGFEKKSRGQYFSQQIILISVYYLVLLVSTGLGLNAYPSLSPPFPHVIVPDIIRLKI